MKNILTVLCVLFVFSVLSGCAHIQPIRDTAGKVVEVKSTKFGADLAYKIKTTDILDGNGRVTSRITEEEYETRTNADRILDSLNSMLGTAVDAAAKVKP